MADRTLAQLTRELRRMVKAGRKFDMAAHLAATRGPKLSPWDKRRPVVIVTGGPNYSLL